MQFLLLNTRMSFNQVFLYSCEVRNLYVLSFSKHSIISNNVKHCTYSTATTNFEFILLFFVTQISEKLLITLYRNTMLKYTVQQVKETVSFEINKILQKIRY